MSLAPSPKTWTDTTDFLTAANLNTELRDALTFLLQKPRVALRRVAAQSIPNTTAARVPIQWDTEDSDLASMWSSGANTKIFTQYAGRYSVAVIVDFAVGGTTGSSRALYVKANGTTEWTVAVHPSNGASDTIMGFTFEIPRLFAVGEYIEILAGQSSGGALNIGGGADCYCSVKWEGKN